MTRHSPRWTQLPMQLWRRGRRAIGVYGLRDAARLAGKAAKAKLHTPRGGDGADAFDLEHGVDTAGVVRLEGLAVQGPNRELGHRYQASDPTVLSATLTNLGLDYSKFTFVDLGSGKGRVLMVAAKFPFARAVGVEFSPELHEIAVRNIGILTAHTSSCSSVEALCLDAAAYEFPATPLVVYLYNPFLPPLMRIVMQHLADSLRSSPRPVYVVLGGDDSLAPIVAESGFVRLPLTGIPAASWVFLTPAELPSFEDRLRDGASA